MKNESINDKVICVFCSSSDAVRTIFKTTAKDVGKALAKMNYDLIYGGCDVGLMGIIAHTMKNKGRKVIGVIPKKIFDFNIQFQKCDELILTDSMRERKHIMVDKADAIVALPGGFGTLEELLETFTLKQLGYLKKPIVILNIDGYYDKLFDFFERVFDEKFAKRDFLKIFKVAESVDQLTYFLENHHEEELPEKWFNDSIH